MLRMWVTLLGYPYSTESRKRQRWGSQRANLPNLQDNHKENKAMKVLQGEPLFHGEIEQDILYKSLFSFNSNM